MIAASGPMLHPGNLVFRKLMPAHSFVWWF